MKRITALLYHDFTTLDALGPLEVLGRLPGYEIRYASLSGGPVSNEKGLVVMTEALSSPGPGDILLIPGGMGSRQLVLQDDFLAALHKAALESTLVMTVCTGSALAAAAGLLDGLHATGNKRAFDWTMSMGKKGALAAGCPLDKGREVLHCCRRVCRNRYGPGICGGSFWPGKGLIHGREHGVWLE